jgi:hypothetical protein
MRSSLVALRVGRKVKALRCCRSATLLLSLAGAGLIASCASSPSLPSMADRQAAMAAAAPDFPCAAEYRALLDLAALARQYGTSTQIFLDPLGEMFNQLDDCLSAENDGDASRGPVMQEIRANGIKGAFAR